MVYGTSSNLQIPDEEKELGPQERLIHVYHFTRDASQNHMVCASRPLHMSVRSWSGKLHSEEVLMRARLCQWEFSRPDLILLNQALSSFPESRTDKITVQTSELQLNYATCLHLQVQNFGEPFFLVMRDNETLGEVKERIQKKLQVPDEEFAKVGSHFSWSPRNWKDIWRVVYFSLLISSIQWF